MFTLKEVRYKNILYVKELSIPFNKVTCIVGESGSGKTTLLKLLNNLISCDSGKILYREQFIEDIDPVQLRREVVMLPQAPLVFPGTVRDNLLAGLQFSGKPAIQENLLVNILREMKLKKGLDEDTATLSGGEKQRLAICRIMLMEPEVLLLDEPTSALDEDTEQLAIEGVIEFSRSRHKSLVMVTHSRQLALKYGELVVTLQDGSILDVKEAGVKSGRNN